MKEEQRRTLLLLYYLSIVLIIAGAGSARAGSLSLSYQCTFPLLEEQPLEVNVSTELPGFVAPGAVLDVTTVSGTATVNEQTRQALRYIGATTLEGRVAANAHDQPESLRDDYCALGMDVRWRSWDTGGRNGVIRHINLVYRANQAVANFVAARLAGEPPDSSFFQ